MVRAVHKTYEESRCEMRTGIQNCVHSVVVFQVHWEADNLQCVYPECNAGILLTFWVDRPC